MTLTFIPKMVGVVLALLIALPWMMKLMLHYAGTLFGGLGAFGGFVIPPIMGFAVSDLGKSGYSIGYIVFIALALVSLSMVWILKYARSEELPAATAPADGAPRSGPADEPTSEPATQRAGA